MRKARYHLTDRSESLTLNELFLCCFQVDLSLVAFGHVPHNASEKSPIPNLDFAHRQINRNRCSVFSAAPAPVVQRR